MQLKPQSRGIILNSSDQRDVSKMLTIESSFKGFAIAGGGGNFFSPSPKPCLRWLGRNYVRGVRLQACEIAGHTTMVGCHITGTIKIEPNAVLEMVGCLILSTNPHGVRVGKQATLRATDCDFRLDVVDRQMNQHIKTDMPGAREISLRGCRFSGDSLADVALEIGGMQTLQVEGCTFEFKREESPEVGRWYSNRVGHGVALMRGVPPFTRIKGNTFMDRGIFVNAQTSLAIEDNRFEKRSASLRGAFIDAINGASVIGVAESILVNISDPCAST